MTVKTVVFDFDGTLVDSNPIKREAYFEVFSSYGETGSTIVSQVLEEIDPSPRAVIIEEALRRLVAAGHIANGEMNEAKGRMVIRYGQICQSKVTACPEIDGASESIRMLSGEYDLYVNSLTPVDDLEKTVKHRGLLKYFKNIFGSENTKTENLKTILSVDKLMPGQVVVVGDNSSDFDSAQKVGTHFIGIGPILKGIGLKQWKNDCRGLYETVKKISCEEAIQH